MRVRASLRVVCVSRIHATSLSHRAGSARPVREFIKRTGPLLVGSGPVGIRRRGRCRGDYFFTGIVTLLATTLNAAD